MCLAARASVARNDTALLCRHLRFATLSRLAILWWQLELARNVLGLLQTCRAPGCRGHVSQALRIRSWACGSGTCSSYFLLFVSSPELV